MKRAALIIIALVMLFAVVMARIGTYARMQQPRAYAVQTSPQLRTITLNGQTIHVSIATDEAARQQGLGGRSGLAADEGMLFVFPKDGIYAFWMKDMRFSIDIVWLAASGRIVYMAQNVSPDTYPRDFVSSGPARYVLELPAGYAAAHTVAVGDSVQL